MTLLMLRVPAEHRPGLRDALQEIREDIDEIIGADINDVNALDAQLVHAQTVTASGLAGLCEVALPLREDIEGRIRAIGWYLDALDVVGSLDLEPAA